jgi:histidinol-phosphatase (PHP family)
MAILSGLASFHGGHSTYGDGCSTIGEIAEAAYRAGLLAYGFAEHAPEPNHKVFRWEVLKELTVTRKDWLEDYQDDVWDARDALKGKMDVLLSLEIDYLRGAKAWTQTLLTRIQPDYLVGSVHYVRLGAEDVCIDADRESADEALRRAGSQEQLILTYVEHLHELLRWELIDIVAHVDLVKMHLPSFDPTPRVRSAYRELLAEMRARRVVLEVNTRGLKKPCRRFYPERWILEDARRLGVEITFADDAHGPDDVGFGLADAAKLAGQVGYQCFARFLPGGERVSVQLPTHYLVAE